jgi:hypothetical protein
LFCGELLVHDVASISGLIKALKTVLLPWKAANESVLCLALAAAIGLIFMRYCRNRRPWQACMLALAALAVVDGARAWLWW